MLSRNSIISENGCFQWRTGEQTSLSRKFDRKEPTQNSESEIIGDTVHAVACYACYKLLASSLVHVYMCVDVPKEASIGGPVSTSDLCMLMRQNATDSEL